MSDRHIIAAIALGALGITSGLVLGPALADEFRPSASGIDTSRLVRFAEKDYVVDHADWVDTNPIATSVVKKVEAGKVSYVTITSTSTGTYSTDSMFSNHVQYPGISVALAEPSENQFRYWSNGRWSGFRTSNANSFVYYSVWPNR